ncbi:MAG: hypothetical protein ABJP70_03625 [Erythrobacter sp.]
MSRHIRPRANLYKPKPSNTGKLVPEILAKVESLVRDVAKIRARHKDELDRSDLFREHCVANLNSNAVQEMMRCGEPDSFDYDFHELRKTYLERSFKIDQESKVQYFLAVNRCSGANLILKTIWGVESSLENSYERPRSETDLPKLEIYFFSGAVVGGEILKMYLKLAEEQGNEAVLAVLSGKFRT